MAPIFVNGNEVNTILLNGDEIQQVVAESDIVFRPEPEVLFFDGFEDNNLNEWQILDQADTITTSSNERVSGSLSLRIDMPIQGNVGSGNTFQILRRTFTPTAGDEYSFWWYEDDEPEDDMRVFWKDGTTDVMQINVHREISGNNVFINGNKIGFDAPSNAWFKGILFPDFFNNRCDFRIESIFGATQITGSANFMSSASSIDRIRLQAAASNDNPGRYYFDNFKVLKTF